MDRDGDIFGDFADYSVADWGMDIDGEGKGKLIPVSENDLTNWDDYDSDSDVEEEDLYIATMAKEEIGMEPERAPQFLGFQAASAQSSSMTDSVMNTLYLITGKASRLQEGFEEILKKEPVIIQFGWQAGAVVKEATPLNNCYSAEVGAQPNFYAPFASELDWKFARWVKLQGPGSTSVTELMAIEGVCIISSSLS